MEEWRDTGAVQGGVTRQAACGSQSSKAEIGLTKLLKVKGHRNDTEEDQSSLTQVKARPKGRAMVLKRVGGDTGICVGVEQPGPTCGRGEGEKAWKR